MKNLVILISGRGSNMEAIVDACARDAWPARVAAVIANRPEAAGLSFAAERGIATAVVDHREHDGREAFDAALAAEIDRFAPDLVVLAGFMRILTPGFVSRFRGPDAEHPSLAAAEFQGHAHAPGGAGRRRGPARRHRAFRDPGARQRRDRRAGGGAGARGRRRPRRWPRACSRPSMCSIRARCAGSSRVNCGSRRGARCWPTAPAAGCSRMTSNETG